MPQGLIITVTAAVGLLISGCSSNDTAAIGEGGWSLVHKPTIQQGNVITQAMLDQLQPGMSQEQVRYLLGTPAVVDTFHPDRWDYVYWLKKPGKEPENKQLSLIFEQGTLARIEGKYEPGVAGEAQQLGEIAVDVPDHDSGGFFSGSSKSSDAQPEEKN